ncbi:Peptidoglycan/LPS O-acetylase OafA/YrhL, contains acyltransferase and SGNH-hydrolase domains [Formivibrio citricus]|uniref:Peptidoglycan/LPS O-acetylase OafA/YrhL, contains acyltransferase and SGNH-hydrolase domains n=1 Tax=Formivibrio citricus TaxID=83765 RepID=A0A1I5DHG4_9NEIS|nr:acyltransferase [Formivibrio citricus]SFN98577.1 Peptidoglycan/LPS O-acetylase OafA/YrhL, contains acyltransferase and SGNH-hydrolase domains [Formivibrio citricus]
MTTPSATPLQRFDVLDSFRGLFALSVVMFHLHILDSFTEWSFFRSAGLFVEYFFTLSGFVLAHTYGNKSFDAARLGRFMVSRLFRIFPLHWVLLLAYTVMLATLAWLDGDFSDVLDLLGTGDFWKEWGANFLLLQAWLPQTDPFSFNGPAWTISVEFPIYAVFGLILLMLTRLRERGFQLVALGCALCVLAGASFISTGSFRGVTCFFIGAAIYPLSQKIGAGRWPGKWNGVIELLVLAGLYACLTWSYPARSLLATCFYALFILIFAREAGIVSRLLKHPVFELLGRWSYSIYLTHYLLISALTQALLRQDQESEPSWIRVVPSSGQMFLDTGSALGNTILPLAFLGVVILISRFSYEYIEKTGVVLGKRLSGKKTS